MIFIFISLMMSYVEFLFMLLFAVYMSSLVKYLFKLSSIFYWIACCIEFCLYIYIYSGHEPIIRYMSLMFLFF